MNLQEFKAWFEGYTESMDSAPNPKQWERIKSRVTEIIEIPTSYRYFIERYREPWWMGSPYYGAVYGGAGTGSINLCGNNTTLNATSSGNFSVPGEYQKSDITSFDSIAAFKAMGRAEAVN